MRWDDLFAELENDLESLEQVGRDAEIADRTRVRQGQRSWTQRCVGSQVGLRVVGLGLLRGVVDTVTGRWLLLRAGDRTDWVVALDAVSGIVGAPEHAAAAADQSAVASRMTWLNAWSVLSRDRDEVHVVRLDGSSVSGVAGRVGKDYVELGGELVPYAAIAAVRCPR